MCIRDRLQPPRKEEQIRVGKQEKPRVLWEQITNGSHPDQWKPEETCQRASVLNWPLRMRGLIQRKLDKGNGTGFQAERKAWQRPRAGKRG